MAIGIAQAIDGGGTAMANFAGGYAKSWAKGQAIGLILSGMTAAVNSVGKEQGSATADTHQAESKQTRAKNSSSKYPSGNKERFTKNELKEINIEIKNAASRLAKLRDESLEYGLEYGADEAVSDFAIEVDPIAEKYNIEIGADIVVEGELIK